MKKLLCLLLGVVMIVCMTGWTTGDIWSPDTFDETVKSNYSKQDKVIASNDKFELVWKGSNCTVDLIEKATGNRWGVNGQEIIDPETGEAKNIKPEAASTLVIEVLDMTNNQRSDYFSATTAVRKGRVVTENINNGIRVFYYFDDISIRMAVDFVLRQNSVAVTVDPKLIQEGDTYRVVSAKVAPYWCSNVNDTEENYIFYPSGSGALVSNEGVSSTGIIVESQVYGFDAVMSRDNYPTTTKDIRLPVFGAVNGETATCAIIEDNAEAGLIGVKAGAINLGYTGAYARFQIRGYSDNYSQARLNSTVRMQVYALSAGQKPMTIGFYPLTGEKANYSGMAETYKNYLKSKGALKETTNEESFLNVSFIGGVMIDKSFLGIPYKDLVAATTINDAKEILSELSEGTHTKISAKLLGFGTTGIEYSGYAGGMKINKNIGSVKDLSALNEYTSANNIDLYYDFDIVRLKNSSAGFNTFFSTAYSPLLKVATSYKYDAAMRNTIGDTSYNVLRRNLLSKGADKVMNKISKWNLTGVSLETLTSMAYSDHSTGDTQYFTKGNMSGDVTEIMNKFGEKYKVAAYEANAYAALAADVIFDTPTTSSRERIFTEDVPFYQMIFKGYVSMSSESLNQAANSKTQLLKNVEAGLGLNYTLIANYYNEFIDYKGYYFFGSQYSDLSDDIISTANGLKGYYKAINGAEITSHTTLESGLRETVFSNGVKVYVNYTDASIAAPNRKIVEADGYVWEK
jgi:hypothetical protein